MADNITLRGVPWAIACLAALSVGAASAQVRPPADPSLRERGRIPLFGVACQGGVFTLDQDSRVPVPGDPLVIEVFDGQASILGVTPLAEAQLRLTPGGTEVRAHWRQGRGLTHGARLDAIIEPATCNVMEGVLDAPGLLVPRAFTARQRLLSGDDTVGGGEGGDPDGGGPPGNTGGHKGFQRGYDLVAQRANPGGLVPAGALEKGYGEVVLAPIAPVQWVNLGPAPFRKLPGDPSEKPKTINSGRVNAVAVDPADPDHWLLGTAGGGVWETGDAGTTWAPRTDDQPSLVISALAFAPSAADVAYAGTGSYSPSGFLYPGVGILKSVDGGTTWERLGAADLSGLAFGGIAVSTGLSPHVVAATLQPVETFYDEAHLPTAGSTPGIYRSTDAGASWELRLAGHATSVVGPSTNPFFFLYAGLARPKSSKLRSGLKNGVFRSFDDGKTWAPVNGPWKSLRPKMIGEVRMAVSPSDPEVLYVLIKTFESSKALGLWRTGNAWDPSPTWTKIPIAFGLGAGPALLVHPTDPNVLYLANAGDAVFRHDPNGWISITQLDPFDVLSEDLIHVDQRALAWAGGERLLVGNDGGLYLKDVADDGPWLPRNEGLSTIQFYAGAVYPDDATVVLGGAQDNGTGLLVPPAGKTWKSIFSGDGMNGFFGPAPEQLALSFQHGWVGRSLDGGATITSALKGFTTQETSPGWVTQVVRCPTDPDTVLYAGFRLWKSTNFFSAPSEDSIVWTPMSDAGSGWFIRTLAFAPSDPSCGTYAFARFDGTLELTTSDGAAWSALDPGSVLPERIPTELAFSPVSADTLWLTFSGFDSQTPGQPGHVFRTDDATSPSPTWANVSPPADLPHNAVAVHPTDSQMVFVGCDLGAWITTDGGATWKHNGPSMGLPNVPVMDLHVGKCSATAFTFGRGAFRTVSLVGPLCVE